jgi:hypothetical protein
MHSSLDELDHFKAWLRPRSTQGIARVLCASEAAEPSDPMHLARPALTFEPVAAASSSVAAAAPGPSVSQTVKDMREFWAMPSMPPDELNKLMDVPDGIPDLVSLGHAGGPCRVARPNAKQALRLMPTRLDSDTCSSTDLDEHGPSAHRYKKQRLD